MNDIIVSFFVISDWGKPLPAKAIGNAMNNWALKNQIQPSFIICLGDNFYPKGVESIKDDLFQTVWKDAFLVHPILNVPYRVVLGNHDYKGNFQAQIDFTRAQENPGGLWYMPDKNYIFKEKFLNISMDFFIVDTNGAQYAVVKRHPNMSYELVDNLQWLKEVLNDSKADWKIVLGHHPLYTKGRKHGIIARCLRDDSFIDKEGEEPQSGYGMEQVLIEGGAHIYLAGHEHVLQHRQVNEIHHFVISSGGAGWGFNGGEDPQSKMDWFNKTPGFLVMTVKENSIEGQFIDVKCNLLHTVNIDRPNKKE